MNPMGMNMSFGMNRNLSMPTNTGLRSAAAGNSGSQGGIGGIGGGTGASGGSSGSGGSGGATGPDGKPIPSMKQLISQQISQFYKAAPLDKEYCKHKTDDNSDYFSALGYDS